MTNFKNMIYRHFFVRTSCLCLFFCLFLLADPTSAVFAQGTQTERTRFDLAQRLFNDGSYANAAQELKQFIINFPTSDRLPDAMLRLGKALVAAGQPNAAVEAFQQFIDRYPNHFEVATAMRAKAQALEQTKEYIKAGQAFQEVHTAYSEGEYAVQDLLSAGINFHKGQALKDAENAFQRLIRQYPQSPLVPEALYNLGRVLLDGNRIEEARIQFRTLSEFSGPTERKPDALLEMGNIALSRDDLPEAERLFGDLKQKFPQSTSAENAYLVLATYYADHEDWENADKTYQNAQMNLPRNTRRQQAVLGRANALRKLGRNDEALALYTEFLKAYPDSPFLAHARLGYGRAFAALKNYRNALDAFKRLQEEFPETDVSNQAYGDIGDIWRQLGTPQKALAAYQTYEARVQSPSDQASARLNIARIYDDLSWYDLSAESYRTLINGTVPQYAAEGQFGLANVFAKTHQTTLSLREYRTYLKNYPDGPRAKAAETQIQLLQTFATPTKEDKAWLELLTTLPVITSDATTQFQLGQFLYKRHDYTRAITQLTAISADTTTDWAPQAQYLLANSYLKLSQKTRLEGDEQASISWQKKGQVAYQTVVDHFAQSPWADDAALALIDIETATLTPDSTRAKTRLEAYSNFQKTYVNSDLLKEAQLRSANAYLLANDIPNALRLYRESQKQATTETQKIQATYGIGVCLSRQKDYTQAEDTLRDFLLVYPQSDLVPMARFQLGHILYSRGFYASAAEEFAELLASPSSLDLDLDSRSLLAECYFQLHDYERAIDIDERLLRRQVTPDLLRRLARSYFNSEQYDNAVATYARFLRSFPNAADADSIAFTRAERLSFLNRTSEAIAAFRDFTTKYTNSPLRVKADQAVGDLLFEKGDYAEAITIYQRIPDTAQNAEIAGREVLSLYRLKRVKEADKAANQFKKTYKTAIEWLALFSVEEGKYHLALKNPKKARETFEDVISKYPKTEALAEASYYLARAYYNEGPDKDGQNDRYLNAISSFVKNFPDSPHWVEANLELAKFWDANEEYGSAARYYRNALEKGVDASQRPEILFAIAQDYNNLRAYDLGIEFAKQLVHDFPQHKMAIDVRTKIGQMLQLKGDYEQSINELIPLLSLSETEDDRASIRYMIAENYFKMGEYNNARREFLVLRYNKDISPNWIASAQVMIARCYAAQGDINQAIAEYEEIKRRFGPTSDFGLAAEKELRTLEKNRSPLPGR